MIVNYNGYTKTVPKPTITEANATASELLRELVAKHYVPLDSMPKHLPMDLRIAAHRYINSLEGNACDLLRSIFSSSKASNVHKQLSWLCVNSLSMIVPSWKRLCEGTVAEESLNQLRNWLENPSYSVRWDAISIPRIAAKDGTPIADCDACRLEPIANAVANAATYLELGRLENASECLLSIHSAYEEGCRPLKAPNRFETWLVFHALRASLECKSIGDVAKLYRNTNRQIRDQQTD